MFPLVHRKKTEDDDFHIEKSNAIYYDDFSRQHFKGHRLLAELKKKQYKVHDMDMWL